MNKQLTTTICKDHLPKDPLSLIFLHSTIFTIFYPEKKLGEDKLLFLLFCVYFLRSNRNTAIANPASIAIVEPVK